MFLEGFVFFPFFSVLRNTRDCPAGPKAEAGSHGDSLVLAPSSPDLQKVTLPRGQATPPHQSSDLMKSPLGEPVIPGCCREIMAQFGRVMASTGDINFRVGEIIRLQSCSPRKSLPNTH